MAHFRIDFNNMPWDEGRPGMRQKVHCQGGRLLRLVEFFTSEGFEHWCEQGHIGYVLVGGLKIEFKGEVLDFRAGDGLFIPAGMASKHRSVSIIPGTRLLMVEDATD